MDHRGPATHWRKSLVGSIALIACLPFTGAQASPFPTFPVNYVQAGVQLTGSTGNAGYLWTPISQSSTTGPVSASSPCDTPCIWGGGHSGVEADAAGHASPGGNVGAASYSWATFNKSEYGGVGDAPITDAYVNFGNALTVQSISDPTTGLKLLPDGTPVQLGLSLRMDGSYSLGVESSGFQTAANSPGGFTASADVSSDFQLYDPAITGTGEAAGSPQPLASARMGLSADESAVWGLNKTLGGDSWLPYNEHYWSVQGSSNSGDNIYNSNDSDPFAYCDGRDKSCASSLNGYFDSGILNLTINTFIGHTLYWEGSLDVLTQAYGIGALASADFGHTLTANLTPLNDNVSLDFVSPQTTSSPPPSVPEPGAWSLMLIGLTAIAGAVRRRRQG